MLLSGGFKQEGLARSYLKINGVWRDHLLFGLLSNVPAAEQSAELVHV